MHALELRPVTAADQDSWLKLRHELWPDCPLERHRLEIDQLLSAPGVVVLAWVEGQPAGFAEISIRNDHVEGTSISPVPYLEGWYVRPLYRGSGVGRALMTFAEQWALKQGHTELASDAELENTLSIALHGKLGFREVGRGVHFVKALG
jgi:aminoglycoside 6'-N-acetyltransferase I